MTQIHESSAGHVSTAAAAPPKQQPPVFTDAHPEFPFLVYNHETRQTKAAKDKDDKEKLAKEGFVDEPFPPLDPDALTEAETQQLQTLLAKAAKALAKLGKLSTEKSGEKGEKHETEPNNHKTAVQPPKK